MLNLLLLDYHVQNRNVACDANGQCKMRDKNSTQSHVQQSFYYVKNITMKTNTVRPA